jgi:hypothetical protein
LKLADIKRQLIDAYFTAAGEGVTEAQLEAFTGELLKLVNAEDHQEALETDLAEHEDPTLAYRALMKDDCSLGYVLDEDQALYVVARHGKKFSSVNLTSPNRAVRPCTLREVREAFLQAPEHSASALFKVKAIRS